MNKEKGRLEKESNQQILVNLMKNHGDMVLRVAFTYVKDKQLAEDLSQEVFIRCYQSIHHFENRSSYKTWIYRITVNCCKDYVKSWSFRNIIPRSVVKRDNEQYLDEFYDADGQHYLSSGQSGKGRDGTWRIDLNPGDYISPLTFKLADYPIRINKDVRLKIK
ncbi:sigma-70 family RNA polymerase sigma factor [Bacillus sp. SCS-151]|uniref:sigma-70 family RNA polymerase sigma factor n=1 Tax=Nanhaiella sioensis TaxID=3115293 RepID=UPI00397D509F